MRVTLCVLSCLLLTTLRADDIFPSTQGHEPTGMVNPSSRFQVENGWNLFLNTEFLWWIAQEDGLFYAQSGYTGDTFGGRLETLEPNFRPGCRIGLGGNMPYDDWDLFIDWTWYASKASDYRNGNLLALWTRPFIFLPEQRVASHARGKWHFQMNVLDAQIGRSFWVGKKLSLHPFVGARAAWLDQVLTIKYTFDKTSIKMNTKTTAASDFEGGGARAGVNSRWTLLGGWSVYADASAALLYGFYDCQYRQKVNGELSAQSKNSFHQPATTAQLALGVEWDLYAHTDRYHVGVWAGWEQNVWFGMNKMSHFFGTLDDSNVEKMNGDLSLSGGTAGVRFDF